MRLLRFLEPDCSVGETSACAAQTLLEVVLSKVGREVVRAGFWVGTINSAPSVLSERMRDQDGQVTSVRTPLSVMGFDMSTVEVVADARSLVELLRVQLDGLEDCIEWPDCLAIPASRFVLWKMPGETALVMLMPESMANSLGASKAFQVEIVDSDDPEHKSVQEGLGKLQA